MDATIVWTLVIVVLVLMFTVAWLFSSISIVTPNERALYYRGRRFVRELPPGLNFITPIAGKVIRIARKPGDSATDSHIPTWEEVHDRGLDRRR